MKKRQIDKLCAEIAEIDRKRRRGESTVHEHSLTVAEQRFVEASDARGKKLYRSGWPDFMVVDKETGGVVFVEVKCDDDEIRRSQALMFAGLEEHLGVRVMVWNPARPGVLTPWRSYEPGPSTFTPARPRTRRARRIPEVPIPERITQAGSSQKLG